MPQYMLLLYADQPSREQAAERESEFQLWMDYTTGLREAGVLVGSDRLMPADSATTVRVRQGETEIVDGPFATTKELLGGYYLLECADLDAALDHATRCPMTRYGSVEVRPVMEIAMPLAGQDRAAAGA